MSGMQSMRQGRFTHYTTRKFVLKELGFNSYQQYLESDLWREIRANVLKANSKCQVCTKDADIVHHKSYTKMTMMGLKPSELVPLCNSCHYKIEFEFGEKTTLDEADRRLRSMLNEVTMPETNRRKYLKGKERWLPTLNNGKVDYTKRSKHIF